MRVFSLDEDACLDDDVVIIDLDTEDPIDVFIQGPPGTASGKIVETETDDLEITVDALTLYVVVWAIQAITINIPLSASRLQSNGGVTMALPITIKNETGVDITLVPSGSDVLEVTSENFINQSVTLLPRTGGYSAI